MGKSCCASSRKIRVNTEGTESTERRMQRTQSQKLAAPELLGGSAADASEHAEFAKDDGFEIDGLVVPEEVSFGARGAALDAEVGINFMFGPCAVLDDHLKRA